MVGWPYPGMGIIIGAACTAGACGGGRQGAGGQTAVGGAGALHVAAAGGTSTTTFCRGARTSISSAACTSTGGEAHRAGGQHVTHRQPLPCPQPISPTMIAEASKMFRIGKVLGGYGVLPFGESI